MDLIRILIFCLVQLTFAQQVEVLEQLDKKPKISHEPNLISTPQIKNIKEFDEISIDWSKLQFYKDDLPDLKILSKTINNDLGLQSKKYDVYLQLFEDNSGSVSKDSTYQSVRYRNYYFVVPVETEVYKYNYLVSQKLFKLDRIDSFTADL